MAFASNYITLQQEQANNTHSIPQSNTPSGGDLTAMLLMGALAGTAMTKAGRRQMRAMQRKLMWQALGAKVKGLFGKKSDQIAGMDAWLFILLVVLAAALGIALFGLWGFIVILALAAIIYLLLKQSS